MNIVEIDDPSEKSRACERILRALPQWFGIEAAILDYVKDVQAMQTWVAIESSAIGFVSVNKHSESSAEIHVMGVLPDHHRKQIGAKLMNTVEESLASQGIKYLTVKTLSASRPNREYDQTRQFYQRVGFTAFEEFKTLWGEHNPCLMMIKTLAPFGFAVIFSSKRMGEDHEAYESAAAQMLKLAQSQRGFLGAESRRDSAGAGITVSYWKSLDDIKAWKSNVEHLEVQELGRTKWYESFTTKICRIEREYKSNAP